MRWEAVLIPVMSMLALLTVGGELVARLGLFGVLVSEVLLVGLPAWLWLGFREVTPAALGQRPRVVAVAGGLVAGLGGFYLMAAFEAGVLERILPMPPELRASLRRMVLPEAGLRPLAADLLALALAPALCEELLFRGGVMTAYAPPRAPKWQAALAVGMAALLFGVIHASPHRFLPAMVMGLGLGVVRLLSGSLWPAVAFHLANNVAVIVLLRQGYDTPPGGTAGLVGAGVTLAAGLALTKWGSQRT